MPVILSVPWWFYFNSQARFFRRKQILEEDLRFIRFSMLNFSCDCGIGTRWWIPFAYLFPCFFLKNISVSPKFIFYPNGTIRWPMVLGAGSTTYLETFLRSNSAVILSLMYRISMSTLSLFWVAQWTVFLFESKMSCLELLAYYYGYRIMFRDFVPFSVLHAYYASASGRRHFIFFSRT